MMSFIRCAGYAVPIFTGSRLLAMPPTIRAAIAATLLAVQVAHADPFNDALNNLPRLPSNPAGWLATLPVRLILLPFALVAAPFSTSSTSSPSVAPAEQASADQKLLAARTLYNMSFDGCMAALFAQPIDVALPACQAIKADKEGRRDEANALLGVAQQNGQSHAAAAQAASSERALDTLPLLQVMQQQGSR